MKSNVVDQCKAYLKKISLESFDQKNKIILFFFIGLLLVGYTHIKTGSSFSRQDRFRIDTIIPNGYVLIPIKLLNAQAISAAIGSHGVADIYNTYEGQKTKLLFSKAKIIKSEEIDDSVFSVLVKESKAQLLSNSENPFFAAVQNPKAKAADIDKHQAPQVQIIYQN